jgi:hypothetical protein
VRGAFLQHPIARASADGDEGNLSHEQHDAQREKRTANEPDLSLALAQVSSVVQGIEKAGIRRDRVVIAGF